MRIAIITTVSIAALAVAGVAIAGGFGARGHRGWHGQHGKQMDPVKAKKYATFYLDDALDELDASDDQREQIQSAKDRMIDRGFARPPLADGRVRFVGELVAAVVSETPEQGVDAAARIRWPVRRQLRQEGGGRGSGGVLAGQLREPVGRNRFRIR